MVKLLNSKLLVIKLLVTKELLFFTMKQLCTTFELFLKQLSCSTLGNVGDSGGEPGHWHSHHIQGAKR